MMRIAVCVSGVCRSNNPKTSLTNNNNVLRMKFPMADFYYATWNNYKSEFEQAFASEKCYYFAEPSMHYHPYLDIRKQDYVSKYYAETVNWVKRGGKERINWTSHHTKQILIHTWLINSLSEKYDVIIRTRFDAFIAKDADFSKYLIDTHTNNRSNSFAATKKERFDSVHEFSRQSESMHDSWLTDQLIIHNASAITPSHVETLHKKARLHAAEYGWYQVISMPHGSNHRTHDGWVNHDRNILDKFFYSM